MTGKIAGYKIDRLATKLTEKTNEQIEGLNKQMSEEAKKVFLKYVPTVLLDAFEQFPKHVTTKYDFLVVTPEKERVWVGLDIPGLYVCPKAGTELKPSDIIALEPELYKFICAVSKQRDKLRLKHRQMQNQIKCVVSKLGTYSKLRKEFPEAYKVLVEDIDGEELEPKKPEPNLCDSVEEIRAKLKKGGS